MLTHICYHMASLSHNELMSHSCIEAEPKNGIYLQEPILLFHFQTAVDNTSSDRLMGGFYGCSCPEIKSPLGSLVYCGTQFTLWIGSSWYSVDLLKHSQFNQILTIDIPYLTHEGEIWGVYYEYLSFMSSNCDLLSAFYNYSLQCHGMIDLVITKDETWL